MRDDDDNHIPMHNDTQSPLWICRSVDATGGWIERTADTPHWWAKDTPPYHERDLSAEEARVQDRMEAVSAWNPHTDALIYGLRERGTDRSWWPAQDCSEVGQVRMAFALGQPGSWATPEPDPPRPSAPDGIPF